MAQARTRSADSLTVAVLGASGYAGSEVLRLCAAHPRFDVVVATGDRSAGRLVGRHTASLSAAYPDLVLEGNEPASIAERVDGVDVLFSALPHGRSQRLLPDLVDRVGAVVDLAADFRLRDPAAYARWYGEEHACPELLDRFAYGLPELFRSELVGARLVAAPGCYPTAASLALAPLVRAGLVDERGVPVVVDAASGVSGAGRAAKDDLHFAEVDGDFRAYGLLGHRHTAEMEQALGVPVLFTPHLAPMVRGILATAYVRPAAEGRQPTSEELTDVLREHYRGEPFVVVDDDPPSTKSTAGTNVVRLTARSDPRTGWLLVLAAIDNLVKGAAGQAVQCANLATGQPETAGLPLAGLYP